MWNGLESWRRGGVAVVLTLVLALILGLATPAAAKEASLVMDADTGRVLSAANADNRNHPASLTKMMTLYLVFEALESGRWGLTSPITASARAARQPASRLGLAPGQTITVEQAILALVTKSANDVATAVAEAMDRQERDFALRMTAKARALGMTRTTFRNASGLPNRSQLSTARDMATLARALLRDYPQYYHYFETDSFRFAGRTHPNHNKLLETYAGADGIKTGYIRASGFNLVASAKRGGHRLIGVVFGGRSPKSRNRQMARLLDRGFARIDPYLAAIVKMTPKRKPRWAGGAATSVVPSVVPSVAQAPAAPADATPASVAEVASGQPSGQGDGDWGVQVGAYTRQDQAYDMARRAVSLAAAYLDDGTIKVVPLTKGKRRPLYRSRVLGLSKKQAYRACRLLKSKRVGCMELRATREVAQAD